MAHEEHAKVYNPQPLDENSRAIIKSALADGASNQKSGLNNLARLWQNSNNPDLIRDICIEEIGSSVQMCKLLGDHLRTLNLHEEALSIYSSLAHLDESNILTIDKSIQLKILERYRDALDTLLPLLNSRTSYDITAKQYGINLFYLAEFEEAFRWLEKAISLNPGDEEAINYRFKCFLHLPPETAERICNRGRGALAATGELGQYAPELLRVYSKYSLASLLEKKRKASLASLSEKSSTKAIVEKSLQLLKEQINLFKPFSFIRIGDGEGAILARDVIGDSLPMLTNRNINVFLDIWFHQELSTFCLELSQIQSGLNEALAEADAIGVPDDEWITREWNNVSIRGVSSIISCIEKAAEIQHACGHSKLVLDADIPSRMHLGGFIEDISRDRDFLGIITCRNIADSLSCRLGVGRIDQYLVPSQHKYTYIAGPNLGSLNKADPDRRTHSPHYPDIFTSIIESIIVPYEGALFFVGAGILGKLYCKAIKDRGGAALDLGSLFDAWSGIYSRSYIQANPSAYKLN